MGEPITKTVLKQHLMDEIDSELKELSNYAVGDDEKKRGVENIVSLYSIVLKEEDNRIKEAELQHKKDELKAKLESEKKKSAWEIGLRIGGYVIEGVGIIAPIKAYLDVAKATFIFEEKGCVTTLFGKTLPRLFSPKIK